MRANFAKAYTHPVSLSGRHTTTEDGIPARYGTANRHSECADCHNVHQLTPDYVAAAAPYASKALKGVPRISVNNVSATQVTYTYRSGADPTPAKEYEVCFVCHSSWTTQPAGQTNYAAVFNTKNPSFHPVEAAAVNAGIKAGSFTNGWGPGMLVTCTDCHTSDDTTIRGPHGSANQWILKKPYVRANSPAHPSNGVCFECHSASVYNTSGSTLSRFTGCEPRGPHARRLQLLRLPRVSRLQQQALPAGPQPDHLYQDGHRRLVRPVLPRQRELHRRLPALTLRGP